MSAQAKKKQPQLAEVKVAELPSAPPSPKERKVAILGTTPSRMEAPIGDESWEIWTIGPGGKDAHRWDRLFEMHHEWPEDFDGYLNDLSKVEAPRQVYTLAPMQPATETWARRHGKDEKWLKEKVQGDFASNVVIDRGPIFEKYGRMWFSSSIAYAIVIALEEGVTHMGLWGIDLESGEEYISQHAGCRHFLDLARLAGVTIYLPEGCGLMRDLTPYPDRYETHLALTLERKHKWLTEMLKKTEPEYEKKKLDVFRTEGALLMMRKLAGLSVEMKEKKAKIEDMLAYLEQEIPKGEQELVNRNSELGVTAANINRLKGELDATQFYRRMYCWGMIEPV